MKNTQGFFLCSFLVSLLPFSTLLGQRGAAGSILCCHVSGCAVPLQGSVLSPVRVPTFRGLHVAVVQLSLIFLKLDSEPGKGC